MENMQVVSKLAYNDSVKVTGDTNDDVLVNRKYVTEELFGVSPWRAEDSANYQSGTTVQHNGFLYRCTANATSTVPGEPGSGWVKISPILGKRSGVVVLVSDIIDVPITHNLGSTNLIVQIYRIEVEERVPVFVPFTIHNENTIVLQFDEAPTTNYHVIIMAFD